MTYKYLRILVYLLIHLSVSGQLRVGREVTIPLNNEMMQEVEVISLEDEGVIIVENIISNYGRKEVTNFIRYDSTLTQIWKYAYEPPQSYGLTHSFTDKDYVYFFFQETNERGYRIIRLAKSSGQLVAYENFLLTRMEVTHFSINGSKALLGGNYNDRAVVEVFNFVELSSKVLPGIYSNNLKVVGIENIKDYETFAVLIRHTQKCLFYIYTYSYEGKLLNSYQVGSRNNVPLEGSIIKFDHESVMLVGNYADNCSNFSTGFFVHDLKTAKTTNFYDFASLDNYLNYLSPKRRKRIVGRMLSRREKGKEYKIRQRIHLHEITPTTNGWLMVAEIYYPEYNSNNNSMFLGYRSYRVGNQAYNQFNYSHAFLGEFDRSGKLTWNNSINLRNVKTRQLNDITQLTTIDSGYILAYPDDGVIRTGIINQKNEVLPMQSYDLKTLGSKVKIVDVSSANLLAWYGQTFLVYGNKVVNSGGQMGVQDVFYLRKLSYDPEKLTDTKGANAN